MKHDVGALPLRDVRRVGCEHLCSFGLDSHLYNAQPCPEACDAFMVAAICISSPQAATSASRCWAVLVRGMYFWRFFEQVCRRYDFEGIGYVVMPEHTGVVAFT